MQLIDSAKFDELVAGADPVVVDFSATWCQPCKMLGKVFEAIEGEYPQVKFVKVDIDQSPDLARRFGINSVPTVFFYKGGKQVDTMIGFKTREFVEGKVKGLL